jgi:hypothetical protein
MLPRQMSRAAVIAGLVLSISPANAQFYGNNNCSSCGPVSAPMATCTPIQPVQTTCYQTVPVTTYRQEKQTLREPYYRTTYEEREVTVMRPVTTQRTVEVPTVTYQNVTEHRTVQRDMGRWITRYTPVQKCSPCQVDARPGMIGWLNRTGYSFRTAFMPNYHTSRQYVPQMMACTVPVTRQVAIRGTRQVSVNETKMVAEKKMERVAVQKLDYRERVVNVMKPQTAYRTVPIGTQTAYGYGGYGYGAATAFAPMILDSRTALSPEPTPDPISRSADRSETKETFRSDDATGQQAEGVKPFRPSSFSKELAPVDDGLHFDSSQNIHRRDDLVIPATYSKPAPGRSGGWAPTSRETVLRSSSQSASSVARLTLTQKSEN